MAQISSATLLAIADSIAKAKQLFDAAIGTTATAGTAAYGAQQNAARVLATADEDQILALLAPSRSLANGLQKNQVRAQYAPMIQALLNLLGASSFDAFLLANSAQVASEFRDMAGSGAVSPAYVFPPNIDICSYAVTGSGAGARTGLTPIDTTLYAASQLEVVTTGLIGAASITATLTCKRADNTTTTKAVTITNGSVSGTAFAVGAGTDLFVDVTAITITGGTAADAFKVRSKLLRAVAL
jgi:hypothetical protein